MLFGILLDIMIQELKGSLTATHVRELVEDDIVFDEYTAVINETDFGALVHVWSDEYPN